VGFAGSDTIDAGKLDLMLDEMESTSVKLNPSFIPKVTPNPSYVLKEMKNMHAISANVTNM
jgi:hypothetical protein